VRKSERGHQTQNGARFSFGDASGPLQEYNSSVMLLGRRVTKELVSAASALLERVQRREEQQRELRARIDEERQPRIFTAQTAPTEPELTITQFAPTALLHGRAGGLSRARYAWRYLDGTLMPESERQRPHLPSTRGTLQEGAPVLRSLSARLTEPFSRGKPFK
jgi:hypothetical protein